jgi:hypothetical protein
MPYIASLVLSRQKNAEPIVIVSLPFGTIRKLGNNAIEFGAPISPIVSE